MRVTSSIQHFFPYLLPSDVNFSAPNQVLVPDQQAFMAGAELFFQTGTAFSVMERCRLDQEPASDPTEFIVELKLLQPPAPYFFFKIFEQT